MSTKVNDAFGGGGTKSAMMMNDMILTNGCIHYDVATMLPRDIDDGMISNDVPSSVPCFGKVKANFMNVKECIGPLHQHIALSLSETGKTKHYNSI